MLEVDLDTLSKDFTASIAVISRADTWDNAAINIFSRMVRNTGYSRRGSAAIGVGCGVELAAIF